MLTVFIYPKDTFLISRLHSVKQNTPDLSYTFACLLVVILYNL